MLNNNEISHQENSDLLKFRDLVITNGDQGINRINRNLGLPELKKFKVSKLDIKKSELQIDDDLKSAILIARANISKVHQEQRIRLDSKQIETTKGITVWNEFRPIQKVGLYVPGGTTTLFSALLMQAIPALIAGCKDIVICTPPNEQGKIDPTLLWIAKLLKITNIYKVGGSQAIFAMTYGTKSIPRVDKIFGPGNKFVTRAKQLVSDVVAIDMPAGPSEVFVASNNINNSELIAADLLSQLEHGNDSKAVLCSSSNELMDLVKKNIAYQVNSLSRVSILEKSIKNITYIYAKDTEKMINAINESAPEHLILMDDNYVNMIPYINNAGSIFCGALCPESFGDYASGSNHTLPTSGYAKTYSGLGVKDFGKIISFQSATVEGYNNLSPVVEIMAAAENLDAHVNAVTIRKDLVRSLSKYAYVPRTSFISRKSNETNILINLNVDGSGTNVINTGIDYFDHMLQQLSKHGQFDINIECIGDLEIDEHHSIEDIAIALGNAFRLAIGDRSNIERYSSNEILVMDETESLVSIDMCTRAFLKFKTSPLREYVGDMPTEMFEHFFISFINTLGFTCHIKTEGQNSHHIIECTFKAFARAFSKALKVTTKDNSTKGFL